MRKQLQTCSPSLSLSLSHSLTHTHSLSHSLTHTLSLVVCRLLLLYSTIVFLSREPMRRACLSVSISQLSKPYWKQLVNLIWMGSVATQAYKEQNSPSLTKQLCCAAILPLPSFALLCFALLCFALLGSFEADCLCLMPHLTAASSPRPSLLQHFPTSGLTVSQRHVVA